MWFLLESLEFSVGCATFLVGLALVTLAFATVWLLSSAWVAILLAVAPFILCAWLEWG